MRDVEDIALLSLSWEGGPILKIVPGRARPLIAVSPRRYARDYILAAAAVLKAYAGEMDANDGGPRENIKATHEFTEAIITLAAVCAPEVDRIAGVDPVERYGPAGGVCTVWCDRCSLFHTTGLSACPHAKLEGSADAGE